MRRAAEKIEAAEAREDVVRASATKKATHKAGRGRPTDYDPWMCEEVVEFGRLGMEVVEFAVELRVTRQTLYNWADQHAEFFDALTRAREASEAFWVRSIRSQAQMPVKETNLSACLSYMGRRFPGWREAKSDEKPLAVPISSQIEKARKRWLAAREEDMRATGI